MSFTACDRNMFLKNLKKKYIRAPENVLSQS